MGERIFEVRALAVFVENLFDSEFPPDVWVRGNGRMGSPDASVDLSIRGPHVGLVQFMLQDQGWSVPELKDAFSVAKVVIP